MKRLHEASEEQHMMVDALARYLRERYPFDKHWQTMRSETGFCAELWKGLAQDLGIVGAALPEECGGLGGDAGDVQLIMEELGFALAAEPYLSTVVLGAGLLRRSASPAARALLEQIVTGDAIVAFAYAEPQGRHVLADIRTTLTREADGYVLDGHKAVVRNAPWASHILVTARDAEQGGVSVALVRKDAAGMSSRDYPTVDGGRAAELYFDKLRLGKDEIVLQDALGVIEQVVDEATLALCAEAAGVMRRLCRDTVDYARERRQFGVPISSFQVLQHRMADMHMQLEQAQAITQLTTARWNEPGADRARMVSSAKVTVAQACRYIGQSAVQIHGGMGMTDELAVGHYFKRATVIEGLFGSVDDHLRRYALSSPR